MTMPAFDPPSDFHHLTVLPSESIQALAPVPDGIYVDMTLGGGGHSEALLSACPDCRVIGLDRDESALVAAKGRLARFGARVTYVHSRFSQVCEQLESLGIDGVDGLIADLGVSSPQLDEAERGMSFRREGPLDMRMDPSEGETAADLIVRLTQDELADVIFHLGEERRSRRVARCIKQALDAGEVETTTDLRRAIIRAVGPRRVGGIDPATRTFQALRLAVNRELEELAAALEAATKIVVPGGVAAFISFHSLEDRLVKRAFLRDEYWQRLVKKPLTASDEEQSENPRSRSAKLRFARRVPISLREEEFEDFDYDQR